MRTISVSLFCLLSTVTFGLADNEPPSGPMHRPPLDEATQFKIDALGFLQQQRNTALDSLIGCQVDSSRKIEKLRAENELLKKQIGKSE